MLDQIVKFLVILIKIILRHKGRLEFLKEPDTTRLILLMIPWFREQEGLEEYLEIL